jgi:quinol monooxygenase YgiN
MAVRLVVTIEAAPGKGDEFAKVFQARCDECQKEPGCLEFQIFQSVKDPDTFTLLELWESQAALDAHAKLNATRPSLPAGLRAGGGTREDYEYKRVR